MASERTLSAIVATALAVAIVVPTATSAGPSRPAFAPLDATVFINEIHYDNAGADAGEAIEVAAPAGTDLAGWSLVLYNGANGATYGTLPLSGVVADQNGGYGTVWVAAVGLQNGAPDGIALVNGTTLAQFLSYEGAFAATNGPATGQTATDIGVAQAGAEPVGSSLHLTGTGLTYGAFTWAATTVATFGSPNIGQTFGTPPPTTTTTTTDPTTTTTLPPTGPCLPAPTITPISEVQGITDVTPCRAGRTIAIEGVVVGDYEGPSGSTLRGFYVQEQDDQHDMDDATSEGVFVFNPSSNNLVALGDVVTVTGVASEFQGQTQLADATVIVDSTGATVTPVDVTLPVPDTTYLERHEGMVVHLPQTLFVTNTFPVGRFSQVEVSSGDRLPQPTLIAEPGGASRAVIEANARNRLGIDDALQVQNPDPNLFAVGGQELSASNTLRGGDTLVAGFVGVMTYTWGGAAASPNSYRVRPIGDDMPRFESANPRPTSPPVVAGDLRIANFNVLNYFLTLDIGTTPACGPDGFEQECRGANTAIELERQQAKLIPALQALDADVYGLIELENSTGVDTQGDIVARLNAAAGADTYDAIDTSPDTIGTDTIRVGIVYKKSAVEPHGDPAILDSSVDPRFDDDRNRPSLAQSFVDRSTGELFTVIVNHLKSKGCDNTAGPDDDDDGDGVACFNAVRTSAAEALVDWMASYPTGVVDDDFIVMGDFNAYAKEDPMDVFAREGFVDLAARSGETYSYQFDGTWGSLDYALASPSFDAQSNGARDYHINADEPVVLDYNTEFKSARHVDWLYDPDEFRTSDHDPVLSGYDLDALRRAAIIPLPFVLWPPNHKLVTVNVFGLDGLRRLDVEILRVTSSEADSGLGPDDQPGDIVRIDRDTYRLRAERFSRSGRRYTITALVTDGRQSAIETTTVHVLPNIGRGGNLPS